MVYNCWSDPDEYKPFDQTLEDTPQMKQAMEWLKNLAKTLDRDGIRKSLHLTSKTDKSQAPIRKLSHNDSMKKSSNRKLKKILVEDRKRK